MRTSESVAPGNIVGRVISYGYDVEKTDVGDGRKIEEADVG